MKVDILSVLAERGDAEATEVAWALGLGYEAASMALMRAYRGGHPDRRVVHYGPTKVRGDDDMRSKKLHSGLYHCPECLYEVTLTAEASLRCEDCKGRLYKGELPDEDSYDDGAEG